MPEALYETDRGLYLPGPLTEGPWSPDAQHGGPVAALLAFAVETVPADVAMQVVRLTVELTRPVPLAPLEVAAGVVRPGKRVQIVEASMTAAGTEVAKARALRIRTERVPVPEQVADPPSPELPEGAPASPAFERTAFVKAVDLRFVKGSWDVPGPVTMWGRLKVPVIAGRRTSALQQAAAIADFGNGVSHILDFETHSFINPDLTVALSRVPTGEWIGYDAVSRLSPDGWGQAESLIFDQHGPAGRAVQSLIVQPR